MFHKMRRSAQTLTDGQIREVLERNTSGVLSLLDENGYTYGVPLSYLLREDTLYFHCATAGAKLDALRHHDKVSFTVIDRDEVVPEEYSTRYRSVIVFGQARTVTDPAERDAAIRDLGRRYAPAASEETLEQYVGTYAGRFAIIALQIHHLSGKKSKGI